MNTRGTQRIALVAMMITILIGSTIVKFDFRTPSNRLDDEIRLDSQHENASKIIEGWWSSSCCNTSGLEIKDLVSDGAGNMYVTGSFEGQLQLGYTTLSSSGKSLFVAKLDSRGQWKWAIQTLVVESSGLGIDYDPVDNTLFVVGFFKNQSGSFSDSSGTLLPTFSSDSDDGNPSPNFLAVAINSDNGTVGSIWVPDVTDDPRGQFEDVHVNAYGVYATGVLIGSVSSAQNGGTGDMLVSSFNKTDLSLYWAVDNCVDNCTSAQEWGYHLSSDTNGDIFAAGMFIYDAMGVDFDDDSIQLANEGLYDIAIWKLSPNGISINASSLASNGIDFLVGLEVVSDHVLIAGAFTGDGSLDSAKSIYGQSLLISLELDLSTRWVSGIVWDDSLEGDPPSITSISSSLEGTVQVAGVIDNPVDLGNITVNTSVDEYLLVAEMEPSSTGIVWTNGESVSIPSSFPLITSFDEDEVRIVSLVDNGLVDFAEGDYVVENDRNILVVAGFDWDRDADAVADVVDNCPFLENGDQDDFDSDSEGDECDEDDDGDGIIDTEDACRYLNSEGNDLDGDGCPDPVLVGCTDPLANNYSSLANFNSTCDYDLDDDGVLDANEVSGCTDPSADNFDLNATDSGTCTFTNEIECDSCDQVNSEEDNKETQLIDIIDDGEYSEEVVAAGGGTIGGLIIAKIYRWLKERGKKVDARNINKLKNTYDIVKDEIEGETGGSVKDKQNYWESKHYFRPGLERQVAMTISSDPDLDEYSE
ncbi:MAG TPA: hypothetical protein EYO09_05140 [Candidatus Poseidoniales archaeon]|nr:hypothetical protein [Candidatus Poseidoniales archaeon]